MTFAHEKLSPETILNLHRLGFKLIPISMDGSTPCARWGKIYENGWNAAELLKTEFVNVATSFGKSHVKDENNRNLYLNCLDVDSEEAYDRLCIVLDTNQRERFLINQLRNLTYVTKTRKEHGYHIYWLSHRQNEPIRKNNCKIGYEFELKTDKSSGLAALPESRHRDDANFRYSSVGQNKLRIDDSLYDEFLRLLDDCIIKERTPPPSNNAYVNRQLSETDVQKIVNCLSGFYIKGFRHEICYAISGVLYKKGIGLETTSEIIKELAKQDEERKARFAVMRHTYSKDVSEVTGLKHLLGLLKVICNNDRQALDILLSILKVLNPTLYESTKIEHNRIAEDLIKEYSLKSMKDTQELFYYDETTQAYANYGDAFIRKELELLIPEIDTRNVNEILQKIKRKTSISRQDFDATNSLKLSNGLLDLTSFELMDHSPKYLVLSHIPVEFNRDAKCPKILRFLGQVLRPKDVFTLMQFVGYCLVRSSKFEKALFLIGPGDNGKGVLIKLIESFLGEENVSHVSLKEFSGDMYSRADLYGKLANTCADLEIKESKDISVFKQMVSGDSIRAQRKYENAFTFRNRAKSIYSSNHVPIVVNPGYAWYKRIIPMAMTATFTENKNVNLIDELTTAKELSGFLNLVIIALKQLTKQGEFANISDVREISRLFDEDRNSVKDFVSTMCVREISCYEKRYDTYNAYKQFCKSRDKNPVSDSTFGAYLRELGINKDRLMVAGIRYYIYRGIKLKPLKFA